MNLTFAESNSFDPYFNLSFENYLFDNVQDDEIIFFLWQNEKTVVLGSHQNIYKECNVTALQNIGGKIARRLSGGGAVFHDKGNLNFTFISKDDNYDIAKQLNVIVTALEKFGIHAEKTGRNDIAVEGRKFSGSAFRKANGTSCHHGTIMVDVDAELLQSVLNVDKKKLLSHGVASVSSRTVNLQSLSSDITIGSMKDALKDAFLLEYGSSSFDTSIVLEEKSLASFKDGNVILEGQENFADSAWIYGKNKKFTSTIENRFSWGDISLNFVVEGSTIKDVTIFSDCLFPTFIERLEKELVLKNFSYEDISNAIDCSSDKLSGELEEQVSDDIKNLVKENI